MIKKSQRVKDIITETDKLINSMAGKVERKTTEGAGVMTEKANTVWDNIIEIMVYNPKVAGRLYNKMMVKVKIPYAGPSKNYTSPYK